MIKRIYVAPIMESVEIRAIGVLMGSETKGAVLGVKATDTPPNPTEFEFQTW